MQELRPLMQEKYCKGYYLHIQYFKNQERKKDFLHCMIKYLSGFSYILGLTCNIIETKIIPIGVFDREHILCPDIKLDWEDDLTLLLFYIDNKVQRHIIFRIEKYYRDFL